MLIGRWNNRRVELATVAGLSGISGISDILRYGDHILSNPIGSVVLSVLTVSLAPSIPRVLPVCLVPFVPPVLFTPVVPRDPFSSAIPDHLLRFVTTVCLCDIVVDFHFTSCYQ